MRAEDHDEQHSAGERSEPPLHPDIVGAIAASGVVRTFPRHAILINEGDRGDTLYVILSGRVKAITCPTVMYGNRPLSSVT